MAGSRSFPLALGALALLGAAACLYATHNGPGLFADSKYYLGGARALLAGRGYSVPAATGAPAPITDWPPLYSLVLAGAGGLSGLDPERVARWLNAALLGATIFLGGLATRHLARGSAPAGLFGAFLLLASVDLLNVHSYVGSEGLFIFLGLAGLMLLGRHLERPKPGYLVAAGALVGLGSAARYVGVVLLGTGILALLLLRTERRLRDAAIFAALGCAPVAAFVARNQLIAHEALGGSRSLVFHPITADKLRLGWNTVWGWVAPDRSLSGSLASLVGEIPGFRWGAVGVALLAAAVALAVRRPVRSPTAPAPAPAGAPGAVSGHAGSVPSGGPDPLWLPVGFLVLYAGFLLVSISFLDAQTQPDPRILSPAFVAAAIAGVALAARLIRSAGGRGVRSRRLALAAGWLGALVLAASYAHAAAVWIPRAHGEGLGYARAVWRESDILRKLELLPPGTPIYTNGDDAVTLVTGRPSGGLPAKISVTTRRPNPRYSAEMDALGERLRAGAVVVYLHRITWRAWLYPSEEELRQRFGLRPLVEGADGVVWGMGRPRTP